jgi:Binding-prot-dependent transport system membrane comp, N-term
MLTTIGKRLLFAILSLIGGVIVRFLLTRALPGDPAAHFVGPPATREAVGQICKKLGLDKPLIEHFVRYASDLTQDDFGSSLTTGQPVATEIRNRLQATAETDIARSVRLDRDRASARCAGRDTPRLLDRSSLSCQDDGRRIAPGVLHRAGTGLCVL